MEKAMTLGSLQQILNMHLMQLLNSTKSIPVHPKRLMQQSLLLFHGNPCFNSPPRKNLLKEGVMSWLAPITCFSDHMTT
jgi:hypothetical protein